MQKLYDVVFGQKEFEKTKIDVRFDIIESLIHSVSISSLEDFEYLESCLYKIKDQLRVKSSNLNKVIRDPQKALSKKKVLKVVNHLLQLRNTFLNNAFTALIKENPQQFNPQNSHIEGENYEIVEKSEQKPQIKENTFEPEEKIEEELFTINPIIFENDQFSIVCITTTTPYLRIHFKEELDLVLLRNVSTLLFETYDAQGTTIIIEQERALIIPRKIEDAILNPLPQNKEIDVKYVEQKLLSFIEDKKQGIEDAKYVEIDDSNKIRPHSNPEKETSLDSLLSSIEEKNHDPTPKPKPKEDSSEIEIEKSPPIEIEKAPPDILNDEIKIIKKEVEEQPQEKDISSENYQNMEELPENLIYQDDQLIVYLNKNSKAFGEILIKHTSQKLYNDLTESELSYISIFTKIFSSLLFDTLQSHGTNIFWSSNENILHIVPRIQNDSLNFQWKSQEHSDEFLEQIKGKLFQAMSTTKNGAGTETNIPSSEKKIQEPQNNEDLKRKAQNVLEALRKIP